MTICMIVAQVKFVAHNIFNGIFWFFFPASLVICNDITAYFWCVRGFRGPEGRFVFLRAGSGCGGGYCCCCGGSVGEG